MKKLSIITINLNNDAGLRLTGQSIINQTCQDYEWIIIDGKSTDGSLDYITSIAKYLAYHCSEKDKGIYDAQNKGVSFATSEYCLFLNSGDYLADSNVLERILPILNQVEADVYRCAVHFALNGQIVKTDPAPPTHKLTGQFFFEKYINHVGTIIRRSLLIKHPYDLQYRLAADFHFFRQIYMFEKAKDCQVNFPLSVYDLSGVSTKNDDRTQAERRQSFIALCSEPVYRDYRKFVLGENGNVLDKCRASWRKRSLTYYLAIAGIFIPYLLHSVHLWHKKRKKARRAGL